MVSQEDLVRLASLSGYDRMLAMGLFLGLITYFVHGVLNNYLDTDKASAPFWGFLALLVVLDLCNEEGAKGLTKSDS